MTSSQDRGSRCVLFPFIGAELGGSHVSAFTLAEALQQQYGTACVVLCAENTQIAAEALRRSLTILPSGERPALRRHSPAYDIVRAPARFGILRTLPVGTVVHFNDISAVQSWGPVARFCGSPIVYHHRSLNQMTLPKRLLIGLADHVICISKKCTDNVSFVPPRKTSFILNRVRMPQSPAGKPRELACCRSSISRKAPTDRLRRQFVDSETAEVFPRGGSCDAGTTEGPALHPIRPSRRAY